MVFVMLLYRQLQIDFDKLFLYNPVVFSATKEKFKTLTLYQVLDMMLSYAMGLQHMLSVALFLAAIT